MRWLSNNNPFLNSVDEFQLKTARVLENINVVESKAGGGKQRAEGRRQNLQHTIN
jgi:hypothetical protein